nr:Chain A, Zinc finger protein 473 [Homo sapiens]
GSSGSSGEKPYSCAECKETFSDNNRLVQHQKMHTVKSGPSSG